MAVINIVTREEFVPEIKVIDGKAKLKKNGTPKRTHSNAKVGRSTWVEPIRKLEDIDKILDYINDKIENEEREDYRWQWERNKMYFVIAIFSGFRVCDLVGARSGTVYKKKDGTIDYPKWTGLKWSDIFEKDGKTFKNEIKVKELKTGHMREVELADTSKLCIEKYVDKYQPDTKSDEYLFLNRQKKRLSATTIDDFIKEVTAACGIDGNYSTHSLRKTCVYQMYMSLVESKGEQFAIAECMRFTGHRSIAAFFSYLGIQKQDNKKRMDMLSNRLSRVTFGKI